ncbi:MAG: hypothetical protein AAGA21_10655 [Pseudomonadota bacterium]
MITRSLLSRLKRLEAGRPEIKRVWIVKKIEGQTRDSALAAVLSGRPLEAGDDVIYCGHGEEGWLAALNRDPGLAKRIYANDGRGRRWIDAVFDAAGASPQNRLDSLIKP